MDEHADEIKKIRESTERIERWLVGDEAGGQPGLIDRNRSHDRRIARLERWVFQVGGIVSGIVAISVLLYRVLTDWWPHK